MANQFAINAASLVAKLPPLHLLPARPPHTYMAVAHEMYKGVSALAEASSPLHKPLALLAAHTLECALKACLTRDGSAKSIKEVSSAGKGGIGHNLNALWMRACKEGLAIPSDPPQWVESLSLIHDKPYALRYLSQRDSSTGEEYWVHGISTPPPQTMVKEIGALLGEVERYISAK